MNTISSMANIPKPSNIGYLVELLLTDSDCTQFLSLMSAKYIHVVHVYFA